MTFRAPPCMYVCSSYTENLYLQESRSEYFLRRRNFNFTHNDLIILFSLGVFTPRHNEARHVVCHCGQVVILYHRTGQISPTSACLQSSLLLLSRRTLQ